MGIPIEMTVRSEGEEILRVPRRVEPGVPAKEAEAGAGLEDAWDDGFAALAARHAGFMVRVAQGLLRNPQDAEDAVQECLLKLYRTGGWRGMEDERAFLARAVWRVGLDVAARRARHRGTEPLERDGAYAAEEASAEMKMIEGDARALLRGLIDGLPEELRQPLVLSAIEEMTGREVGAALGLHEGTVRTRVARARAELRRRYLALEWKTGKGGAR